MKHPVFTKSLAGAAVTGLFLQLLPVLSAAATFTDVPTSHVNSDAITGLQEKGVVEGYENGTFKPESSINRAEFLKIVLQSRGGYDPSIATNCFSDVHDEWFAVHICSAKKEGIISGYPDGTYKPEQPVSFVEAGKILTLAFDQQTQGGSEWYEPYARALEASKAIPLSINDLDEKLTRGEMAEMMWRLKEGITTQPSKGYLNVKYPEMNVNTSSDDVQTAISCEDLRAFTEEAQKTGTTDYYFRDGMKTAVPSAAPMEESLSSGADADHSTTNVQVAGVDEGDIVKTDGTYIYTVANGTVRIVKAVPATTLDETAVIDFADESFRATDLYIDSDRLIVIGTVWKNNGGGYYPLMEQGEEISVDKMMIWPGPMGMNETQVRIYNVSNKSNPTLERKVTFDGSVTSSRRIEGKLYLVLNQSPMYWGGPVPLTKSATAKDLLPSYSDSAKSVVDQPVTDCAKVSILPHVPSPQYLMVGVIPVRDTQTKVVTEVILGSAENIYASLNNLFVTTTQWNYNWGNRDAENIQNTSIYRFAYTADGVDMQAEGTVRGRILNQFSMDEHENNFRIATTIDQVWMPEGSTKKSSNNLYVLNMNLDQVGEIEGIAPGESIYSARFMGDRAYMVTFKQVDPLFVLDTSDPRNPKILGKLKIPGYSDYLHPYDETHLIGFGKEVDETIDADKVHDDDSVYYTAILGMKVALFDVTDVSKPQEMYKVVIGDRGTESPLLYDHRALLFEKDRNLLSFPVNVMELPEGAKPTDTDVYPTQSFQGAYVYTLTLKDGFKQQGRITQYSADDVLKAGGSMYGQDIERVLRIGETLYSVSQSGVQSNKLDGLAEQDSMTYSNTLTEDVVYPPFRHMME